MSQKPAVTLALKVEGDRVTVDVVNRSREVITIVTHPRYLLVELLDGRGQFVRGKSEDSGMPDKKSFVDVAAGGTAAGAFVLDVARDGDHVEVGAFSFDAVPTKTALRVTYKPDTLVPNLPSSKRRSFFRGPVVSERVDL